MAILAGTDQVQGNSASTSNTSELIYGPVVTATTTGTATTIGLHIDAVNLTSAVKLCVYSGAGSLLTSAVVGSLASGWVTASINLSITADDDYILAFIADPSNQYLDIDVYSGTWNMFQNQSGSYASPPATITARNPGSGDFIYGAPTMYLDGTTGPANTDITSGVGALTAAGNGLALDLGMPLSTGAVTTAGHNPALIERSTRYAYPSADLDAGPWTPSTGTALYAMIDESVADDGDYIVTNTAGVAKITLMPVSDPAASSGHVVNYRIWSPVGGNATVRLVQGASTVIASWDHTGLPTTPTNFSQGLSGAEADSITNYDDLHIEFEAT